MHPHPSKLVGLAYLLTRTAGDLVLLPAPDRVEGSSVAVSLDDLRGVESRDRGRVQLIWSHHAGHEPSHRAAAGRAELELADSETAARLCGRLAGVLARRRTRRPHEAAERAADRAAAARRPEGSQADAHSLDVAWDAERLRRRCAGLSSDSEAVLPSAHAVLGRPGARVAATAPIGPGAAECASQTLSFSAATVERAGGATAAAIEATPSASRAAIGAQPAAPFRSPLGSRGPLRLRGVPMSHPIVRLLSLGERSDGGDEELDGRSTAGGRAASGERSATDGRAAAGQRSDVHLGRPKGEGDATPVEGFSFPSADAPRASHSRPAEPLRRVLSVRLADVPASATLFLEATWHFPSDAVESYDRGLLRPLGSRELLTRLARAGTAANAAAAALLAAVAAVAGGPGVGSRLVLLALVGAALALLAAVLPIALESRAETQGTDGAREAADDRLGVLVLKEAKRGEGGGCVESRPFEGSKWALVGEAPGGDRPAVATDSIAARAAVKAGSRPLALAPDAASSPASTLPSQEPSLSAVSVRSRSEDDRRDGFSPSLDVESELDGLGAGLLRSRLGAQQAGRVEGKAVMGGDAEPDAPVGSSGGGAFEPVSAVASPSSEARDPLAAAGPEPGSPRPLALSVVPPAVPSQPAPLPLPEALLDFARANPGDIDRDTLVRFHRAMDGDEARAAAALGRLVAWLDATDARRLVDRPQPFFAAIKRAWAHGILCRTKDGQHVVTIEAMGKLPKALAGLGTTLVEVPRWEPLRGDRVDAAEGAAAEDARAGGTSDSEASSNGCGRGASDSDGCGREASASSASSSASGASALAQGLPPLAADLRPVGRPEALLHLAFLNAYISTHVDPRPWPGGQVVRILDAEGLGFGDLRSEGFKLVMDAAGMLGVTQPQRLHRAFVVNAPMWWAAAWKLISPLMEAKVSEKFRIFRKGDPKAREALLELVREEDLPTSLGGSRELPLEDGVFERALRAHVETLNSRRRVRVPAEGDREAAPLGGNAAAATPTADAVAPVAA